jgi:hypothetical protein
MGLGYPYDVGSFGLVLSEPITCAYTRARVCVHARCIYVMGAFVYFGLGLKFIWLIISELAQ